MRRWAVLLLLTLALPAEAAPAVDPLASAREQMLEQHLKTRGISDARVLDAMRRVPRERFVPPALRERAYEDRPLPIGEGQTISQPYIVALMSQVLRLKAGEKVLEIGTGSGYQAAVLAEMGARVYSIEIVAPLARQAAALLHALNYQDLELRIGDGYRGWPEAAPFDAIVVTAAPEQVPAALVEQLALGGRLVIPVGAQGANQQLRLIERTATGTRSRYIAPVRFVPMTGEPDN